MDAEDAGETVRWSPVAEEVFCPAAVACGERRVALFMRGAEGELLHRERDGDAWSDFRSLGLPVARIAGAQALVPADWPISACSTGTDEIHLLARSPEGELLHGVLRGSDWGGFDCVGAPAAPSYDVAVPMGFASAPTACSRAPGHMDVFAVGAAGGLLHCTWDGAAFSEFESLGGAIPPGAAEGTAPIAGSISACSCGGKAMGVFARGAFGDLLLKWWNDAKWTPFASLGTPEDRDPSYPVVGRAVPLAGPPAACGGGSTRLDVFARGPGGDLLHRWWDGKSWSVFESMGMPRSASSSLRIPFTGPSLACVWGKYRLDVFARAADGRLYNAYWEGKWDHAASST